MPTDAPRLDDLDCPRSWTWPEGPEQTLHCEARGNPEPSVHCARPDGGAVLALGLLGPVTRALAGTYRCTAVNGQGQAVKDVTLTVECESEGGVRAQCSSLLVHRVRETGLPIRKGEKPGLSRDWENTEGKR